jgi:Family of unknown function (DUF6496)
MPEKKILERARADRKAGKAPSTQAGEFIREQIDHIREGRHGVRSAKQAIAIGLSEARRAGVDLPPPDPGKVSPKTRRQAARNSARGRTAPRRKVSAKRSQATENALKREGSEAASPQALARQARSAAARRSPAERSEAARRAARTKGAKARGASARTAARGRNQSTSPRPQV